MSITLVFEHKDGTYYLPRANARLTGSAEFHVNDELDIGGVRFYITGFRHQLADIANDRAPITFAYLKPLGDILLISEEALMRLQIQGFKKEV